MCEIFLSGVCCSDTPELQPTASGECEPAVAAGELGPECSNADDTTESCDKNSVTAGLTPETSSAEQDKHITQDTTAASTSDRSPTHSILTRSADKALVRNKSLKRVSFEEQPEIIEEDSSDTKKNLNTTSSIEEEVFEDLATLGVHSVRERAPTPPLTMANAEEQLEIPVDNVDGEPVIPKKERKPHIKGITFREFDVSKHMFYFRYISKKEFHRFVYKISYKLDVS